MQRGTCRLAEAAAVLNIGTATAYHNAHLSDYVLEGVRALKARGRYTVPIIGLENLLGPAMATAAGNRQSAAR